MMVCGRGIDVFVLDTKPCALGDDRTYYIHGQFRSLQDFQGPRHEVLEGHLHNRVIADSPHNSRCAAGLLNGNIGVVRSMMGEITDSTNRAQVSGLLPLTWGVGVTIGYVSLRRRRVRFLPGCDSPLAGGSLSRPHERFPALFGNRFWEEYPYLLSCLFPAAFCAFCFVLTWLFLKEVRGLAKGLVKSLIVPPLRP